MNKRRLTIFTVLGGFFVLGGLAIAKGLHAAHGGHRGHHSGKMAMLCGGDRDTKLDKMSGLMASKLNLNEDQSDKWSSVINVVKESDFQSLCLVKNGEDGDAPGKLKNLEQAMTQGLSTIQKAQVPFQSFYGSLDKEQQNTLNGWFSHRDHH